MRNGQRLALLLAIVVTCGATGIVGAFPFPFNVENDVWSGIPNGIPTARDDNDGSPDINDAVNILLGTSYAHNADIDPRFTDPDYVWSHTTGSVALIGLTAGNSNTLGVYTGIGTGAIGSGGDVIGPYSGFGFLGDGSVANPFPGATIGLPPATQFGWYLRSSSNWFYTEPGLNGDGYDHVMTFALPELMGQMVYVDYGAGAVAYTFENPFLLTWEDLVGGGDEDYDDMIYLVDKVAPVPEPTSLLLLGIGLAGLGVVVRRRTR